MKQNFKKIREPKEIDEIKSNIKFIKAQLPNRVSQFALRNSMSGMDGRIERQRIKSFENSLNSQDKRMNLMHKKMMDFLNKKSKVNTPLNNPVVFPYFNFNKENIFQNKLSKEINMFNRKRWRVWHTR